MRACDFHVSFLACEVWAARQPFPFPLFVHTEPSPRVQVRHDLGEQLQQKDHSHRRSLGGGGGTAG